MADNVTLPAATGKAATREVTYSGETAQAPAVGLVTFTGSDDAKTATDVSTSAPLPVGVFDVASSTVNITVVDSASSTAAGANAQSLVTGTPTTNSAASFALTSVDTVKVQVTGTWTGTLTPEISIDGGTTWVSIGLHQSGTSYTTLPFTANFIGACNASGATHFRMRATAAMTGTAIVRVVETQNPNSVYIANGLNLQDAVVATRKLVIDANGAASAQPTFGGVAATAGNGASGTSVQRVTIANDSTGILAKVTEVTGGGIAHDGVDSGNPLKIGMRALAHGTNPTAVAAADRTDWLANRAGVPFVIGGHPNVVSYGMSITTAVSNTVVGPTIASGLKFVCTGVSFLLDNASTVFPSVVIGFGTANTPAFATTPGTAKILAGHPGCPAGGGATHGDGTGILGIGADDEEVRITTVGNAGGNGLYVLLKGYTIES